MQYDFDRIIDRRNTHSAKWDALGMATGAHAPDAIAMWVADMDFAAPEPAREALRAEIERGVFGYYAGDETWRNAMSGWLSRRHGWEPDPDWITPTPGICTALGLALQAFTRPGDNIVVFAPVYHAFFKYIEANDRKVFAHPLQESGGRYHMDLDDLERTLPENASMVFFCSPHNPGGTVWSESEIVELAEFCLRRGLMLVSDEIHHDLVFEGATHTITHMAAPEIADNLITCCAATKTFNLAGAHVGGAIISNPEKRKAFRAAANRSGLLTFPLFGMIATEAAQRHGDGWLDALLPYLAANRDCFDQRIATALPGAQSMQLQSTYLAWVDISQCGIEPGELMRRMAEEARVGASNGAQFGPGGEARIRFNLATPRSVLNEALDRIGSVFA